MRLLSRREEAALGRARFAARLLDDAFRVPGTNVRIGVDPLISVVPVSGDLVAGGLSLYIVAEAARCDVPPRTLARMLANVGVDTVGGSVPILGSLVDVAWKANRKNVALLEEHLGVAADEAE